jgi:hypothetical protein
MNSPFLERRLAAAARGPGDRLPRMACGGSGNIAGCAAF